MRKKRYFGVIRPPYTGRRTSCGSSSRSTALSDDLWRHTSLALEFCLIGPPEFVFATREARAGVLLQQAMLCAKLAGTETAIEVAQRGRRAIRLLTPLLYRATEDPVHDMDRIVPRQALEILYRAQGAAPRRQGQRIGRYVCEASNLVRQN